MKTMKTHVFILLTIIALYTSCERENEANYCSCDLIGTWINQEPNYDALIFQNDTLLERKNLQTGSINHRYSIKIYSNELVLKYIGFDKIELPGIKFKYFLNESKDTLYIENLNQYYPYYNSNNFYKLKN